MILKSGLHPNMDSWTTLAAGDQPWRTSTALQQPNTMQSLNSFICPTSALTRRDDDNYGSSSYVGNAGSEVLAFASFACGNAPHRDSQTGVLLHDGNNTVTRLVGMNEVIDGTSNVFLVGEVGPSANVHQRANGNGNFPVWCGGNNDGGCNANVAGSAVRFCGPNFFLNRGWIPVASPPNPDISDLCFGSFHPAGAQFVLVDGSVQFIKTGINPVIYTYLAVRDDGNPTNQPQ